MSWSLIQGALPIENRSGTEKRRGPTKAVEPFKKKKKKKKKKIYQFYRKLMKVWKSVKRNFHYACYLGWIEIFFAIVLVLLMRGIYDVRHWDGLRLHDIYISIFIKTDTGVQAILSLRLRNLKDWNNGNDLWFMPWRWAQMLRHTKFKKDKFRHLKLIRRNTRTDIYIAKRYHKPHLFFFKIKKVS
jgi:hypothetical protein